LLILIFLAFRNRKQIWIFSIPFFAIVCFIIYSFTKDYKQFSFIGKTKKTIKILNHNLLFISEPTDAYIDSILKHEPDVLAFEEVGRSWKTVLSVRLKERYPYQIIYPRKDAYGYALLSKFPISKTVYFEEYYGIPYCQKVILTLKNGKEIAIYNTHLDSPAIAIYGKDNFWKLLFENETRRWKQTENIIQDSKKEDAQIFLGDLNTTRIEPLYQEFRSNWLSSKSVRKNSSLSFRPNGMPAVLALDHVFFKGDLRPIYSEVHYFGNSDHLPTISVFEY
jgi:endonuclease/exonuclease/phosphatase (EEP) superfamily protein YafD